MFTSAIYLVIIICQTSRRNIPVWKISSVVILFLDNDGEKVDSYDMEPYESIKKQVGERRVVLNSPQYRFED